MPARPAPLTDEAAARIINQLQEVVGDGSVVLIGGAALSFWHTRLVGTDVPDLATTDIDFQGGREAAARAATLLHGRLAIPRFEDPTPVTGVVTFTDAHGSERLLDFLDRPYGLRADDVTRRAIATTVDQDGARLFVMHPLDCLLSRVANTGLPGREPAHAAAQMNAAVDVVAAFTRSLLDDGRSSTIAVKLNQEIYTFATRDDRALAAYLDNGIDLARAAIEDPRLPDAYTTQNLPRLRQRLDDKRARLATHRQRFPRQQHTPRAPTAPSARLSPIDGERSYRDLPPGGPSHGCDQSR